MRLVFNEIYRVCICGYIHGSYIYFIICCSMTMRTTTTTTTMTTNKLLSMSTEVPGNGKTFVRMYDNFVTTRALVHV